MSGQNRHCCVPYCTSDGRYKYKKPRTDCIAEETIHFHKIPNDKELKKKWIIAIRRDEGKHFKVCLISFLQNVKKNTQMY